MVKPANRRIEKYYRKLKSMKVAYDTFTETKPDISVYGDLAKVQEITAGILNKHGILKRNRVPYQSFAVQLWKYHRSGQLSDKLLAWLIEGYKLEGCDEAILKEIANAVLGKSGAPATPSPAPLTL